MGRRVNPSGPKEALIAIVGEAPGKEESETGVPFCGGSGQLLTKTLRDVGLNRSEIYITNVVKERPPQNDLSRLHEVGISLQESERELINELRGTKANVIVPLGGVALKALTGYGAITKYRGSILSSPYLEKRKIIPSIHPAYCLRGNYRSVALLAYDLLKAKTESNSSKFIPTSRTYKINPTYDEVHDLLDRFFKAPYLSLDIETDMGASFIKCIGFADSPNFAGCIPLIEGGLPKWTQDQEIEIWKKIKELLTNGMTKIIIQNMMFEQTVLYPYIGEITPVYMDTMIAHHCLLSELRKSLALQTSIYTREPYYKDDAKNEDYAPTALYTYNCKDCAVTYEIFQTLDQDLKDEGMHDYFHGYQMPLANVMWKASMTGIKIDTNKVIKYREQAQEDMEKAQARLDELVGYHLNVSSTRQVALLLYDEMKLPRQFHRKTRKVTTNEEAIRKLASLFPNEIFDCMLKVRELSKLISTYFKVFWDEDKRCRCSWLIHGTETGRLSSATNIKGTGLNMQNQVPRYRDVFVADEGHQLIKIDLSQVEARLVAYLSKSPHMIKVFEGGGDIHSMVASMVLGVPINQITKDSRERSIGKKCVHSANYLIGPYLFASLIGVSNPEGKRLLERYYGIFQIKDWHRRVEEEIKKTRTLTTPFGRKRRFFDRYGDDLLRAAVAYIPQSTASDHINRAAVRLYPQLPESSAILLQVHDEIVIQAKEADVEKVIGLAKRELSTPIPIDGRDVVIPIDIQVGGNWKDGVAI